MEQQPTTSAFAAAAGISISYASEILNGKRTPSRALALAIFKKTGKRLGPITGLSDADIETLSRIEGIAA